MKRCKAVDTWRLVKDTIVERNRQGQGEKSLSKNGEHFFCDQGREHRGRRRDTEPIHASREHHRDTIWTQKTRSFGERSETCSRWICTREPPLLAAVGDGFIG